MTLIRDINYFYGQNIKLLQLNYVNKKCRIVLI